MLWYCTLQKGNVKADGSYRKSACSTAPVGCRGPNGTCFCSSGSSICVPFLVMSYFTSTGDWVVPVAVVVEVHV